MPNAEINGGYLNYEMRGSGPPLVLLLPQSSGPNGIGTFTDAMAQHFTLITYDQRGTGGSSKAPGQMSMAAQAEDVVGLLDALELDCAALFCHSTGCGIGISVASMHTSRADALVLATPWTHGDAHLTQMQNLRMAAARALDPVAYARFNAALLFPPEYRRLNQVGFDRLSEAAIDNPQNADTITDRLNAILAFDARPILPQLDCPTLVAVAQDDQLMPHWFAREAAQLISNSELIELADGGHMLLETRGKELAGKTIEFLTRHTAT